MIALDSFDLEVTGSEAAGYVVQATGPRGERTRGPFGREALAPLDDELEALRAGKDDRLRLERIGSSLFQALFPMEVLLVYVAAKARLAEGQGLRLRLHLPSELAHFPWELLYYPPNFFCLDPSSPVVRFLDLPDPPRPLRPEPPLRLLHLVASPADAPRLDVQGEVERVQAALSGLVEENRVEIVPGRPGTQATLRDRLRQACHVLHFSGHGGFNSGQGYLLFEDEHGYGQPVDSDTLAHLLQGTPLRLAVLNACQSATADTGDAFGSVAASLVRAGLAAVVAYQYAMPEDSALPFAAEFYAALADGFPVDAAVSEGRKAVLGQLGEAWRERLDWATPVLFMQAPDGRILAWDEGAAGQGPAVPAVHIESIRDSNLEFFAAAAPSRAAASPQQAADPLPALLDELRARVRERVPAEKRAEAMEKVATLRGAATEKRPNLALLERIWQWFDAELPELSGAVLSTILGLEPRLQSQDDELLWEFKDRFEEPHSR